MGRPRQPRYVLSTEFDGKRVFLSELKRAATSMMTVTYHAPEIGMALFFTKYTADKLRLELSSDTRQYEVEPLQLS